MDLCVICNNKGSSIFNNLFYCSKHYLQIKRHGHILNRTRFDPNEIVIYNDHAEVIMYDRYGNEKARSKISLEDFDLIKEYKWYVKENGYPMTHIFDDATGKDKKVKMSRLIMNPPDAYVIDHIDRDPLNNQRNNLRICTQVQNMYNQSLNKLNTSGFKGVFYNKELNKWTAQIKVNQKNIYLGIFDKIEDAHQARIKADLKYFGEFSSFQTKNKQEDNLIESF